MHCPELRMIIFGYLKPYFIPIIHFSSLKLDDLLFKMRTCVLGIDDLTLKMNVWLLKMHIWELKMDDLLLKMHT